jgi:phosphoserine phosphatase
MPTLNLALLVRIYEQHHQRTTQCGHDGIYLQPFISWQRPHTCTCAQDEEDIVVSGCPYCLLKIICDRIGIKYYIGSDIDPVKGEINSICYKEHKLEVFRSVYGDVIIDEFHTDSIADKPTMDISKNVFMVDGNKITQTKKDGVII